MTDADRILALEDRVSALEDALGLTYEPPPFLGLTKGEARIVGVMFKADGVATRQRLFAAMYADDPNGGPDDPDNVLKVMVYRIRRKLVPSRMSIETVWGVGYRLVERAA